MLVFERISSPSKFRPDPVQIFPLVILSFNSIYYNDLKTNFRDQTSLPTVLNTIHSRRYFVTSPPGELLKILFSATSSEFHFFELLTTNNLIFYLKKALNSAKTCFLIKKKTYFRSCISKEYINGQPPSSHFYNVALISNIPLM